MNALGYLLALAAAMGMNHHIIEPMLLANVDTLAALGRGTGSTAEETYSYSTTGPQLDPNVLYAFG